MFSIQHHRLNDVDFLESPNQSERSDEQDISLLVIHNISLPPGEFGTACVKQLFCNELDCDAHPYFHSLRGLKVSAHLLIERNGKVTQFVPFNRQAWHAGEAEFAGRTGCNDFSIGIELEGTNFEPFTDAQYQVLSHVSQALRKEYQGLTSDCIVGHSDIAPSRKTDPGPYFDWQRYRESL